jgi:hypothetical protein
VKAAHLGGDGAAMGVLASELHTIVGWSAEYTRIVLDGLAAIGEALATVTLKQSASEDSMMTAGRGEGLSGELGGLSQAIRASSSEMGLGVTVVKKLAEELCVELDRAGQLALGAASIAQIFNEELEKYDEVLDRLGFTEDMVPVAASGNQTEDLSRLYSMESERVLHMQIFGGSAGAPDTSASSPANASGSEFGDDVELF